MGMDLLPELKQLLQLSFRGGAFTDMGFFQVSRTYGEGKRGEANVLSACGKKRSGSRHSDL